MEGFEERFEEEKEERLQVGVGTVRRDNSVDAEEEGFRLGYEGVEASGHGAAEGQGFDVGYGVEDL